MLLDFPYVYKLDGNKLYCTANTPEHGVCGGEIDYDDGFNFLRCTKCGTHYRVKQLAKDIENNKIVVKGSKRNMEFNVVIDRGNGITETKETTAVEFNNPTGKVQHTAPVLNRGELSVSTGYVKVPDKKKNRNNDQKHNNSNNGFRSRDNNRSYGNNRGIVRSSGNNDMKLEVSTTKTVSIDNDKVKGVVSRVISNAKYSEYDAEANIMTFISDDGIVISVDLTSIPENIMETFVALSGVGKELEQAKSDLLEQENKCAEVLKQNTLLKEKIDELESDTEVEAESCSPLEERINTLVKELEDANKEISELKEQLALAEFNKEEAVDEDISVKLDESNKKIAELENTLSKADKRVDELLIERDLLLEEKKKLIDDVEEAKEDKVSMQEHLEHILLEVEEENEILKTAIGIEPLECVDELVLGYDINGLSCINGIVMKISDLLNDIKPEDDHNVIVFINNENGYMGDIDGNVVSVVSINGRTIDDIMNSPKNIIISNETSRVISVEEKDQSGEIKEAPVGAVQQ